ncbi:MAG: hypothetical protein GX868_17535 [Actinobacteria bacterium]|nr:hypothetical protein [Actinomycetota bacterium]
MANISTTRRGAATAAVLLGLGAAACVPESGPGPVGSTTTTEATTTTTTTEVTTTTEAPQATPLATFSSTAGLATGSPVTVTGTGFDPALITAPSAQPAVVGIYVAIGIGDGPVPTTFTSAKYIRPTGPSPETATGAKLNADGSFTATINAVPLFTASGQTVNCYIDACKIFVFSAHTGSQGSWNFSTPVTFATPSSPIVHVSKTTNLGAEETVTVVGAGFATTYPGIYVWQAPYTNANKPSDWATNADNTEGAAYLPNTLLAARGGAFRTTVATKDVIGLNDTDCRVEACTILTVKAHGQGVSDDSQTTWTPLAFAPAPAPTP